jgi:hypothetical protein
VAAVSPDPFTSTSVSSSDSMTTPDSTISGSVRITTVYVPGGSATGSPPTCPVATTTPSASCTS